MMDIKEYVQKYCVAADQYDDSIRYGDGYCDYANGYFDDEENGWGEDEELASIFANGFCDFIVSLPGEEKKSDMPGTRMDTQSISHPLSADEEKTNMDVKEGTSAEKMATERLKKEKRKSKEDGVESEQNDGIETAIEVKKKKESISKSDA